MWGGVLLPFAGAARAPPGPARRPRPSRDGRVGWSRVYGFTIGLQLYVALRRRGLLMAQHIQQSTLNRLLLSVCEWMLSRPPQPSPTRGPFSLTCRVWFASLDVRSSRSATKPERTANPVEQPPGPHPHRGRRDCHGRPGEAQHALLSTRDDELACIRAIKMAEAEGAPGAGVRRPHVEEQPVVAVECPVEPHRVCR